MSTFLQILTCILGAGGTFSFIQFLINRKDEQDDEEKSINNELKEIKKQLKKDEENSCRTQMLLLMSAYPDNVPEILKVAQHYFEELNGDWYLSTLFSQWLEKHNIPKPNWFNGD